MIPLGLFVRLVSLVVRNRDFHFAVFIICGVYTITIDHVLDNLMCYTITIDHVLDNLMSK